MSSFSCCQNSFKIGLLQLRQNVSMEKGLTKMNKDVNNKVGISLMTKMSKINANTHCLKRDFVNKMIFVTPYNVQKNL